MVVLSTPPVWRGGGGFLRPNRAAWTVLPVHALMQRTRAAFLVTGAQ